MGEANSHAAFCSSLEIYPTSSHRDLDVTLWPAGRLAWLSKPALRKRFEQQINQADGVHIHGLWEQSTSIAGRTARALRKPYILSAHGMLEPWALANKRFKKILYARLFERANLEGATCLHALTHAEARDYRSFGLRRPIAIVPNGVYIPDIVDPDLFLAQYPGLKRKRILLFLGRIHFKKGLDILVQAWAKVAKRWPDAHLVLAGPDFEGTRASIEELVQQAGIGDQVLFTGMLRADLKWSALAAAQGFVLPSYSEGLSVAALEAMGTGLPVILTEQCNLPEVKTHQAGWQVESNVPSLTSAIEEFLSNSVTANLSVGKRGRRLVLERYNWAAVAAQMSEVYQWAQGGPAPANVDLLTV